MNKSIFLVLIILLSLDLSAAPMPTAGSSILNSPQWSSAFSQMGFSLKNISTEWVFLNNSNDKTTFNQELSLGLKTLSETARLNLKIETPKNKTSVENYVKKFLRDYNQYGFELLSSKTMILNNSNVVVVDLMQKNKATQSRQIFLSNKDKILTATCIDKTEYFQMTSTLCNQLLNNLNWN